MEITFSTRPRPHVVGIPWKSLENAQVSKGEYASDEENARLLEALLAKVPRNLGGDWPSPFPLLEALRRVDANIARQLIFIAAANHRTADERRTAEYLLRNRDDIATGRRTAHALLLAARCGAEMDVRRVQLREAPVPREALASWPAETTSTRTDDPSVGEMVLTKLQAAIGYEPTPVARDRILDAVLIALELGEQHGMNRGKGPSLVAMRSDVRRQSRLVTHLRRAFGDDVAARSLARLLVGADGTPIESALLWWCAHPRVTASDLPPAVRERWVRYLRTAERAFATGNATATPGCRRMVPAYPQARTS